jgi:integrase
MLLELVSDVDRVDERLLPSPFIPNPTITPHAVAMSRFAKTLSGSGAEASWPAAPPTPHGLRRTLATRAAELAVPGEDVRALLNHSRRDVTGRHYELYDRAREKRQALDQWALAHLLNETEAAEPVRSLSPAQNEQPQTSALHAA